jgi:P-type Ca2+ transporter type 2C
MRRPPRRPDETILSRAFLAQIALYGGLIAGSTLGIFVWARTYAPAEAMTMSFMTLAIAQILHLGNARSDRPLVALAPAFRNPFAVAAVVASVAIQVGPLAVPALASVLRIRALSLLEWAIVAAFASVTAVVGQVIKVAARAGGASAAV